MKCPRDYRRVLDRRSCFRAMAVAGIHASTTMGSAVVDSYHRSAHEASKMAGGREVPGISRSVRFLPRWLIGLVCGIAVEALVGRGGLVLLAMGGEQGGVEVDDQRGLRAGARSLAARIGEGPCLFTRGLAGPADRFEASGDRAGVLGMAVHVSARSGSIVISQASAWSRSPVWPRA